MVSRVTPATILVVDDDDVLLQVLGRVLRREGHTVRTAATSAEAVEAVAKHPVDLALLDLALPDGGGVELARDLHARLPSLRTILMTAYPLRLRDYPDLTRPFARVLTKPADLSVLREAVATALLEDAMHPSRPTQPPDRPETSRADGPPRAMDAGSNGSPPAALSASAEPRHRRRFAWLSSAAAVVAVLAILAAFIVFVADIPLFSSPAAAGKEAGNDKAAAGPAFPTVELVKEKG